MRRMYNDKNYCLKIFLKSYEELSEQPEHGAIFKAENLESAVAEVASCISGHRIV